MPLGTPGSPRRVGETFSVDPVGSCEDFEVVLDLRRYSLQERHLELDLLDMLLNRGKATGTQAQTMPILISATLGTNSVRVHGNFGRLINE